MNERRTQPNRTEFNLDDLQWIQKVVERIDEAIIAVNGNIHVLKSIHRYYQGLLHNRNFHLRSTCRSPIQEFLWQVKDIESSFVTDRTQARHLRNIAVDRKELVKSPHSFTSVYATRQLIVFLTSNRSYSISKASPQRTSSTFPSTCAASRSNRGTKLSLSASSPSSRWSTYQVHLCRWVTLLFLLPSLICHALR